LVIYLTLWVKGKTDFFQLILKQNDLLFTNTLYFIYDGNQMDNQPKVENPINPNNRLFTLLGKIFLVILIISVFTGAGFYFGRLSVLKTDLLPITPVPLQKDTPTPTQEIVTTTALQPTVKPTESVKQESLPQKQTFNIKVEDLSFSLQTPPDWQLKTEKENYTTVKTISSGQSALVIRINLATEGAPCGFKDAPLSPSEMFPDISEFTYDSYTEFKGSLGQIYRRVDITANPSAGKSFFAVCQKRDTDWLEPTTFGFITYEVPYSDNPQVTAAEALTALDAMVASLKTVN